MSSEYHFEYVPGQVIRYERQGNGPRPVLLLHGFAASSSTWDDFREQFPPDQFTVYSIDLLGFGRSAKPRNGSFGPLEQAETILAFLGEFELFGTCLVGHSYGGTVALLSAVMALGSDRRHLVGTLVLMGAPAWPQRLPRFFRYLKMPLIGSMVLTILPNRFVVTRALESVYFDRALVDENHIERYADCFRGPETLNALVRTVRQIIPEGWEDFSAAYDRLDTPLLLIWGRHDRVVRLRQAERLRDTVPGARLEIIEQCGHNPHEERPGETWGRMKAFLREWKDRSIGPFHDDHDHA